MDKVIVDKVYLDNLKNGLLEHNIIFDENTVLVFDNHMITFMDRIIDNELIDSPKEEYEMILPELSELSIELATDISNKISKPYGIESTMMEIILVATHLQANTREKRRSKMEDKKIVVVIGHRMGGGKEVAKGIEEAGGTAIVIPGMAADMKVGDVMDEHDADLGISFCGSGGAGALTAQNKYGYKSVSHIRSIDAAVTAVRQGNKVIGLGFLDQSELGRRMLEEYKKVNAK